jgi:hypothetical protein
MTVFMKDAAVAAKWDWDKRLESEVKNALDPNFLKTMVKGDVVELLLERFG